MDVPNANQISLAALAFRLTLLAGTLWTFLSGGGTKKKKSRKKGRRKAR